MISVFDTINERLKDLRDDYNLKQVEIAKILGVSQANYSRWETGKELIPLEKLNFLCNYFHVRMDYIIGISEERECLTEYLISNKTIGYNLKKFRLENNITQVELAEFLNTTHSTISAYESGKTTLLTAFALQIVYKYHISLDKLCGRSK